MATASMKMCGDSSKMYLVAEPSLAGRVWVLRKGLMMRWSCKMAWLFLDRLVIWSKAMMECLNTHSDTWVRVKPGRPRVWHQDLY